jgi:hypothetical protein
VFFASKRYRRVDLYQPEHRPYPGQPASRPWIGREPPKDIAVDREEIAKKAEGRDAAGDGSGDEPQEDERPNSNM